MRYSIVQTRTQMYPLDWSAIQAIYFSMQPLEQQRLGLQVCCALAMVSVSVCEVIYNFILCLIVQNTQVEPLHPIITMEHLTGERLDSNQYIMSMAFPLIFGGPASSPRRLATSAAEATLGGAGGTIGAATCE